MKSSKYKRPLCIFGAGGSAKEVYYLAKDCGYTVEAFIDLNHGSVMYGVSVQSERYFNPNKHCAVVAVGSPVLRKKIVDGILARHNCFVEFPSLIHPTVLMDDVELGYGAVISAHCVLTCEISIGNFCQLNIATTISHEVKAGDYLTASPGSHITGNNIIGNNVFLGSNVSTIDKITICNDVVIGAGACVISDINQPGTYVGVPAKKVN